MTELSSYSDSELMAIAGKSQGVDAAILKQESGNNPNAPTSIDGAIGQSQIIPATFARFAQPGEDIHNEADNLAVGQRYRDYLSKRFNGDPARIATAYFSGEGNVAPLDSQTPWLKDKADGNGKMVSSYVSDIMKKISPVSEAVASESAVPDLSDDELKKIAGISDQSAKPDTFDTVADNALQGATFGLGNRAAAGLAALVESGINGQPLADNYKKAREVGTQRIADESSENPLTAILANLGGALATGGLGAGTKTGAAIGDSLGSGNAISRVAKGALAGAASGGLYGAGTAEYDKAAEGAKQGAIFGGLVGGAIPAVGAVSSGLKNLILPDAPKEAAALAQKAKDLGIPLSRSQIGESRFAKTLASTANEIPLSGSEKFYEKQSSAFNRAIAKTFGEDAEKITPDVIDSAFKNIGAKYDSALAGKKIPITNDTIKTLNQIQSEAADFLTPDHAKIVSNAIGKIVGAQEGGNGVIAGEKLGSLRSQITTALKTVKNEAAPYLAQIRDAIIDMSTTAAPELKKANAQYKALKTIEPLAVKATQSGGNISPSLLQQRVAQSYGNYARGGGGELGDLARIGQRFLKDTIPNSGTAKRLAAYHAFTALPGAAIGAYENRENPIVGAAAGALGTMALARGFNAANNSPALVGNAIKSAQINSSPLLSLLGANATGAVTGQKSIRIGLKKVPSKSIQP